MTREEILRRLKACEPELRKLGFSKLYLFGSVARDDPAAKDVDLLYEVAPAPKVGFLELTGAMIRLEEILGRPVDLVDRRNLHHRIKPRVEAEMIEVYR